MSSFKIGLSGGGRSSSGVRIPPRLVCTHLPRTFLVSISSRVVAQSSVLLTMNGSIAATSLVSALSLSLSR